MKSNTAAMVLRPYVAAKQIQQDNTILNLFTVDEIKDVDDLGEAVGQ